MKKLVLVILTLLAALFPAQADAQSADWEVVVYAEGLHQLLVLAPEGIRETIPLPEEIPSQFFALSPDRRYIAFDASPSEPSIQIYGTSTQQCCEAISLDAIEYIETGEARDSFEIIAFNPKDSTQLLLSYVVTSTDENDYYALPNSGLMVINVETQTVVAEKSIGDNNVWAAAWTHEGIIWVPEWIQPPGGADTFFIQPEARSWNPDDADSDAKITGYLIFQNKQGQVRIGEWLELTGEYVLRSFEDMYPDWPPDELPLPVLHYQTRNADAVYLPPRIFVEIRNDAGGVGLMDHVEPARWVADGNAIFLLFIDSSDGTQTATLLLRDGSTIEVDFPSPRQFLAGTPDGWLSEGIRQSDNTYTIYHNRFDGEQITVSTLTEFNRDEMNIRGLRRLQSTPLGATASLEPFPTVPLPVPMG